MEKPRIGLVSSPGISPNENAVLYNLGRMVGDTFDLHLLCGENADCSALENYYTIHVGTSYKRDLADFRYAINICGRYAKKGEFNLLNSLSGILIHNSFLYQLASIGVIGFLMYSYIYFKSFLTAGRIIFFTKKRSSQDRLALAFLCSLIGMCIELSFFRVISGKEQWLIIYFILLYYSTGFTKSEKIGEKHKQAP